MYSYGPPHMAGQKQDDQLEPTYSSYVRIQDVALKTCQRRWMIGRSGERGSGISVPVARHGDDDDIIWPKQFKLWRVFAVVGCSMVIIVLLCCALLHCVSNLKVAQMNLQCKFHWGTYTLWVWTGPYCCESNQKHLLYKRWRHSWPEHSNQMVQENLPTTWWMKRSNKSLFLLYHLVELYLLLLWW